MALKFTLHKSQLMMILSESIFANAKTTFSINFFHNTSIKYFRRKLMKPGCIYILTNDSMPGVVKVGRTERQPETRSKELHTTGVPQPFRLEYFVCVDDCHAAEQQVHSLLEGKGLRTSSNREFFNAPLHDVIQPLNWSRTCRKIQHQTSVISKILS